MKLVTTYSPAGTITVKGHHVTFNAKRWLVIKIPAWLCTGFLSTVISIAVTTVDSLGLSCGNDEASVFVVL